MKKVLVAAAGLMLAGTMASTAMADVTFSGDARARYYNQQNYGFTDTEDAFFNSRVRLQWKATTKGGAYAVGRFRLADAKWDGTSQTKASGVVFDPVTGTNSGTSSNSNLFVDKAYIGVPFGPVTVEAGLMYRSVTNWFLLDVNVDALQFIYKADEMKVTAFMDKLAEDTVNGLGEETDRYGIVLKQGFSGGWGLTVGAMYTDDDGAADASGFEGTVMVDGAVGDIGLTAELSYREGDIYGTDDDHFGGYIGADFGMGAANIGALVGFTKDGFVADGDFGPFIMLSDVTMIATGINVGAGGDWFFGALSPEMKVSEDLTIGGNLAYANVDVDGGDDYDAFEIGAYAKYAVTDGAALKGYIGYLDVEDADENPFGMGLSLEISF